MAHIWKVTQGILNQNMGFITSMYFQLTPSMVFIYGHKIKDINNVGITWLTDSPCNNHIIFHFEIQCI